jgi:enoyl-CoA hydratase/carnithine racemase
VSSAEAERIGLVNRAVDDAELMQVAMEWAETIAGRSARGVRATLGYLQTQADMSRHDALRWAELSPAYMGLQLRPFQDAAQHFFDRGAEPDV